MKKLTKISLSTRLTISFNQYKGPKPDLYDRYIDDFIGVTSCTRDELIQLNRCQFLSLGFKYTWEISHTSLAFLDIKISVEGNGLWTSVYNKQIAFLSFSHFTPTTTRANLSFSKALHYHKMIQRLILSFPHFQLFHSNATKTSATFWSEVYNKLMTQRVYTETIMNFILDENGG